MFSKNEIKRLEEKFKFRPHKALGQNFLTDDNIKNKILQNALLKDKDTVLEIGPGLGQLTFDVAKAVKQLIAVEYDKKLFSILDEWTKDTKNIRLFHADYLKFPLEKYLPRNSKIKVISNLPYYLSTPIILKLLDEKKYIESAVLTLQKEVAERLTATPSSKEYGSLSLFTAYHAEVKRLFNISKNSFYPVPQVDSAVILLTVRSSPHVKVNNETILFDLIRKGFLSRRKTLVNSLMAQGNLSISKQELLKILKKLGFDPNIRAEELSLEQFAMLANAVSNF